MSEEGVWLVEAIADRFPSCRHLLAEHLKDNDEVLPHVFFGDLTRYVMSLYAATSGRDGAKARQELAAILAFLEQTFAANRGNHQELISVSFLENLPHISDQDSEIWSMLGPNLTKEWKAKIEWRSAKQRHNN